PAPLLERPLVPESGTRALEFHFSSFDQGERICVRKEVIGGPPGMVDPLLNEESRFRGDGVAMIHGQLPEAAHRPGANFLQGKICGPFIETCLMLGDKVFMVSKPGELNVVRERRSMHHLREQPCMGQEFFMLFGKAAVVLMFPWSLGVGGF